MKKLLYSMLLICGIMFSAFASNVDTIENFQQKINELNQYLINAGLPKDKINAAMKELMGDSEFNNILQVLSRREMDFKNLSYIDRKIPEAMIQLVSYYVAGDIVNSVVESTIWSDPEENKKSTVYGIYEKLRTGLKGLTGIALLGSFIIKYATNNRLNNLIKNKNNSEEKQLEKLMEIIMRIYKPLLIEANKQNLDESEEKSNADEF
jgi:hypothetical protein